MNCLKCGSEIEEGRAFCKTCLQDMERYPVKPNIIIHIPTEKEREAAGHSVVVEKVVSKEEQITKLTRRLHYRTTLLLLLTAMVIAMAGAIWSLYIARRRPQMGQNYSVTTSTEAPDVSRETSETNPQ